jgi:hypothetical protein
MLELEFQAPSKGDKVTDMMTGVKMLFLGSLAALCAGCLNTPAKVVETTVLTAEMTTCILEHVTDQLPAILVECNIPKALADEVKVLDTANKKMAAKKAAACAGAK